MREAYGLAKRRTVQRPEPGLDIAEHDVYSFRLYLAIVRHEFRQRRDERVSLRVGHADRPQLQKCGRTVIACEHHLLRMDKTDHHVTFRFAQFGCDNFRCRSQERRLLVIAQRSVRLNRQVRHAENITGSLGGGTQDLERQIFD
jgi:hypothetical protein